jgi:hypothetical protein
MFKGLAIEMLEPVWTAWILFYGIIALILLAIVWRALR